MGKAVAHRSVLDSGALSHSIVSVRASEPCGRPADFRDPETTFHKRWPKYQLSWLSAQVALLQTHISCSHRTVIYSNLPELTKPTSMLSSIPTVHKFGLGALAVLAVLPFALYVSLTTLPTMATVTDLNLVRRAAEGTDCYNSETWKYADGTEAPDCKDGYSRAWDTSIWSSYPCALTAEDQICCDTDQAGTYTPPSL